jgi:hypothetical protein
LFFFLGGFLMEPLVWYGLVWRQVLWIFKTLRSNHFHKDFRAVWFKTWSSSIFITQLKCRKRKV